MKIDTCRVCSSSLLDPILDLGSQPWCNDFRVESGTLCERFPLELVFCNECSTLQISYTVPKEIMYRSHTYLSGANKSMPKHFGNVARIVGDIRGFEGELVIDIGSNDGTLLKEFQAVGAEVLGVEPCSDTAERARSTGIATVAEFFNREQANEILASHGKAAVVSAANVFYHVEELHSIVEGVKTLPEEDGVFVIQGTYLPTLIEKNEFDIVYHEHLLYYRIGNLQTLLQMHGLEVFHVEFADVHGGSFIALAGHVGARVKSRELISTLEWEYAEGLNTREPYEDFAKRVNDLGKKVRALLKGLKDNGNSIAAYGAPAKGTVMMNYCGLDADLIDFAVEVNEEKMGTYIPGTSVPVIDESVAEEPDYYFVLSWNFLNVFTKSHEFLEGRRKFVVPIPDPVILTADKSSS